MTRSTNARLAGFLFLFYIAVAMPSTIWFSSAMSGEGIAAQLESLAQSAPQVRWGILLALLGVLTAWALAVALNAITRDQDRELALLAMACRFAEGTLAAAVPLAMLGLLWISGASTPDAPDGVAGHALAALLMKMRGFGYNLAAAVFAVGSTIFAYLFLRARSIPVPLAWLGILASLLLVVGLPGRLVGWVPGSVEMLMWLPMLGFEVTLGLWLLVRAVPEAIAGSDG